MTKIALTAVSTYPRVSKVIDLRLNTLVSTQLYVITRIYELEPTTVLLKISGVAFAGEALEIIIKETRTTMYVMEAFIAVYAF